MTKPLKPIWTDEGQAQRKARRERLKAKARPREKDPYPLHYISYIDVVEKEEIQ